MSNWRPIASAPTDGTLVDVWLGGEFSGRNADVYFGKHPHVCDSQYCDMCPDETEAREQWRDSMLNMPLLGPPTHWMPIPDGPSPETGDGLGQHICELASAHIT